MSLFGCYAYINALDPFCSAVVHRHHRPISSRNCLLGYFNYRYAFSLDEFQPNQVDWRSFRLSGGWSGYPQRYSQSGSSRYLEVADNPENADLDCLLSNYDISQSSPYNDSREREEMMQFSYRQLLLPTKERLFPGSHFYFQLRCFWQGCRREHTRCQLSRKQISQNSHTVSYLS